MDKAFQVFRCYVVSTWRKEHSYACALSLFMYRSELWGSFCKKVSPIKKKNPKQKKVLLGFSLKLYFKTCTLFWQCEKKKPFQILFSHQRT
jgi:hypothetical protein